MYQYLFVSIQTNIIDIDPLNLNIKELLPIHTKYISVK